MALQKQVLPLGFNGLQTKIDPKNAPLGTFSRIENFIINKYHSLEKRDGYSAVGNGQSFEDIGAMYRVGDEIGMMTDDELFAYSESKDSFIAKGSVISPIVTSDPIIANTFTQSHQDSAITTEGVFGSVWEDSRGGIRTTIRDLSDETIVISDYSISATGEKPRIVHVRDYLFYLWIDGTNLHILRYNVSTNSFSSSSVISSNINTNKVFDAIEFFSNVLVVYAENSPVPDVLRAAYWNATQNVIGGPGNGLPATTSLTIPFTPAVADNPPALSLTSFPDKEKYFVVAIRTAVNSIEIASYTLNFLPLGAIISFATPSPSDINYISTIIDENNVYYVIFNDFDGTRVVSFYRTWKVVINNINSASPSIVFQNIFYWYLQVISRMFIYKNNPYCILLYDNNLQGTYFLVRLDGIVAAKLFATLAGNAPTKNNCLTSVSLDPTETTNSSFVSALLKKTKIDSVNGVFYVINSVFSEYIFFKPFGIDNEYINRILLIAGGYVKQYDGYETIYEQGFHLYPEIFDHFVTIPGGAAIPPGTYSYKVVYEWTDNSGQIIRSGTSVPITRTTVAPLSSITLRIKNLPITAKTPIPTYFEFNRTSVIIAIYRTTNGGTTYFRVNQLVSEYVYNDTTAEYTQYVDNKTDAQIIANSVIYTTGGVLDNIGSYACNFLVNAKNRIAIGGTDVDPLRVFFSKEKQDGVGVEFSQELSFTVDPLGGNPTALGAMDDKIIIFKKSYIYFVAGQGPDSLGNGSFTLPQLISSDTGCNQPHSIVLTSLGLMFKSEKGIYLLNRQLSVEYIGQSVHDYNSLTITSSLNLADRNRINFTTLEGRTLVYDTFFSQWFTFTNQAATNSIVGRNFWYFCDSTYVYRVTPGQFYDKNGDDIQSLIKTNWINLAKIEGYYRVYYIYILGDNQLASHRLVANLYYDFENYPRQTLSIIPNEGMTLYGEATPYGNETPYGGPLKGDYQYVIRPKQQKCTSIMIELFDQFPNGDKSKSFKLSEISIVYGLKVGGNRNVSANRRLR